MKKRESVAGTAADPVVQFAELEIDGETYRLAYDFGAIAAAEKLVGCNLLSGMAGLVFEEGFYTASQVLGLLYAATRKAHPKMSIHDVGALCRINMIPNIVNAIRDAYSKSLPEDKNSTRPTGAGEKPAED